MVIMLAKVKRYFWNVLLGLDQFSFGDHRRRSRRNGFLQGGQSLRRREPDWPGAGMVPGRHLRGGPLPPVH